MSDIDERPTTKQNVDYSHPALGNKSQSPTKSYKNQVVDLDELPQDVENERQKSDSAYEQNEYQEEFEEIKEEDDIKQNPQYILNNEDYEDHNYE